MNGHGWVVLGAAGFLSKFFYLFKKKYILKSRKFSRGLRPCLVAKIFWQTLL
jgi:hypothetical protein